MLSQFRPFLKHLRRYFAAYGGWPAIAASPFFLFALFVTIVSYNNWMAKDWAETTKSLVPNLLGFSLGTYSIIFSLVTARVKRAMKSANGPTGASRLEELNATFFHFIFVQVIALLWAILYEGTALTDLSLAFFPHNATALSALRYARHAGSFCGYLLFVYSFLLILGAALAVYRLALIVDPKTD